MGWFKLLFKRRPKAARASGGSVNVSCVGKGHAELTVDGMHILVTTGRVFVNDVEYVPHKG